MKRYFLAALVATLTAAHAEHRAEIKAQRAAVTDAVGQ